MTYPFKLLTVVFVFKFLIPELSNAQCGTNLLSNPSFEDPVQTSIGNNLLGVYTLGAWTVTGGPFNIIKTDGSAYGGGPDNAQEGIQYLDITSSSGTAYQDFTLSTAVPVGFGGYFSSRETGGSDWVASIEIYSMPSNTLVATSSTRTFTSADGIGAAQEVWHYLSGNTTLPAGDYRYVANIGDYGNFDNAFVFSNCVLPIVLKYFSVKQQDNKNILDWKVEPVSQFSHFEIEKSTDGHNFSKIGNVNPGTASDYSFTDSDVKGSAQYYRLKMVDLDGTYKYSDIIVARNGGNNKLTITPNPAKNYLSVIGITRKGELTISDLSGKQLSRQIVNAQSVSINIDFLQSGMYLLQYFDGEQRKTIKFIKL